MMGIEELIATLYNPFVDVLEREAAADELVKFSDDAVDPLLKCLRDNNFGRDHIRYVTINALADIATQKAESVLIDYLLIDVAEHDGFMQAVRPVAGYVDAMMLSLDKAAPHLEKIRDKFTKYTSLLNPIIEKLRSNNERTQIEGMNELCDTYCLDTKQHVVVAINKIKAKRRCVGKCQN